MRRTLISPTGERGSVEDADVPGAIAAGYRTSTSEEDARAEAGQHPGQAAVEGLVDSATFGVGNAALARGNPGGEQESKAPFPINPQAVRERDLRAEENPLAHGAGEFAGYFTPGPGAVSKFARGATEGIASKTVQRLAQGGLEGGIFGLSAAINEDHMGDPKLTAENLAASTLAGSLVGAGVTAAFGKAGDLGRSALIKAFGGKALTESLGDLAEKQLISHLATPSDLAKKNLAGRAGEVARYALDNDLAAGAPSFKSFAERAGEQAQNHWVSMDGALQAADAAAKFDPVRAAERMQPLVDELKGNPALKGIHSKLQGFVNDFRAGDEAPSTFKKAWETTKALLQQSKDLQTPGSAKAELFKLRGVIQEEIAAQMPADISASWQKANSEYSHAATLKKLAEKRGSSGRGLSPAEVALGAVGFHAGGIPGLVLPYAKRAIAERGGFAAASAMDALSQSGALPKLAKGFQMLINTGLSSSPSFGGAFRATLENAAAQGTMDLLKTHLSLAKTQPDYMASIGLQTEDPAAIPAHTDKAHRLGQLSNAVDEAGAETDKHIGRILGEQGGRPPIYAKRAPTRAEFDVVKEKLRKLTGYDGSQHRQLGELAPTTAGLAQMGVVQGAQYLLDQAPKDPNEGLPTALQRPWSPAKGDLRTWFRRVNAASDPRSVLDSMRQGAVSSEEVETLKTLWPTLYKDFQDRMQARLSEWKEPLDRRRRAQIAQLIGDLENPAVTQMIQAAHLRSNPQPTGKAPDGREKLDVDKNLQTQAQRLEGK